THRRTTVVSHTGVGSQPDWLGFLWKPSVSGSDATSYQIPNGRNGASDFTQARRFANWACLSNWSIKDMQSVSSLACRASNYKSSPPVPGLALRPRDPLGRR